MFEDIFASSNSSSNRSANFALLDESEKTLVLNFVEVLKTSSDLTTNSVNSYKSYLTKSFVKKGKNLTSDEKSAVRKFGEFLQSFFESVSKL